MPKSVSSFPLPLKSDILSRYSHSLFTKYSSERQETSKKIVQGERQYPLYRFTDNYQHVNEGARIVGLL
jgi:hypothetical protein